MKLPVLLPLLILPAILAAEGQAMLDSVIDLKGNPSNPFSTSAETVVLIFVDAECPISNKQAPEINRLHQKFSRESVKFWLVYPDGNAIAKELSTHLETYGYSCPALQDPKHELVKHTGATVTPEAVVFHKQELVYRGRINDRHPALGVTRVEATSHDLEEVLAELAEGRKVSFTSTKAVGCYIEAASGK